MATTAAFQITQGDLLPAIEEQLLDGNGDPVVLPEGTTLSFLMGRRRGEEALVDAAAEIVDGAIGHVTYQWQAGDTDLAGEFVYTWVVVFPLAPTRQQTFPSPGLNKLVIEKRIERIVVEAP